MKRAPLIACVGVLAVLGAVSPGSASLGVRPGIAFLTSKKIGGSESVWLANGSGGGAHRLGPGGAPMLAPDGQMVAAATFGAHGSAVTIYSSTGAVVGKFFNVAQTTGELLGWSADSQFLLVALNDTTAFKTIGRSALVVIDTSTKHVTTIAHGWVMGGSFSPTAPYDVVYGLANSQDFKAKVDVWRAAADGSGSPQQLTHDGRSLNPLWGADGIVFDHEALRGNNSPSYRLMLMHGGRTTTIWNGHPGLLVDGLVPDAVSADGEHLLASYVGTDTEFAWTVDLATHAAHQVKVHRQVVTAGGISLNGKQLLVDLGDFEGPAAGGTAYSVPWPGSGTARVLVHKAGEPSWNR